MKYLFLYRSWGNMKQDFLEVSRCYWQPYIRRLELSDLVVMLNNLRHRIFFF